MVETMAVEAVRAVGAPQSVAYLNGLSDVRRTADPEAVAEFQRAMGSDVADPVPFASQVAAAWREAQDVRQGRLSKIESLVASGSSEGPSMRQMMSLQYEMINLNFQQEIVSDIAKKGSDAIETLVRNG